MIRHGKLLWIYQFNHQYEWNCKKFSLYLEWIYTFYLIDLFCISVRPTHPQLRASCNIPAIVSGVCGLLVGIGIGIGFGALIFHPFNSNGLGGGIWFGRKRRKRQAKHRKDDRYVNNPISQEDFSMLKAIHHAEKLYDYE